MNKPGGEAKKSSGTVTIRMSPELHDAIKAVAAARGLSLNEFCRSVLLATAADYTVAESVFTAFHLLTGRIPNEQPDGSLANRIERRVLETADANEVDSARHGLD